ncbi:MAG: phytanoyl-CoA dioxygenase family protein [Candidatus Latescibacterota bacterium]|nr:phytanoyl-CoA dioxygenase family protein [Candidatus Latescibacterota bacterium]
MLHVNWSEEAICKYVDKGDQAARQLPNRGPIIIKKDGTIDTGFQDVFKEYGFYVFENVILDLELLDLRTEMDSVFERALDNIDSSVDSQVTPKLGSDLDKPSFRFTKPLSDPNGGTDNNDNRYEVKMSEPEPPSDAPERVITHILSHLQLMDSTLRVYGHPQLLSIAEQINGPNFTPFTESIIVKPAKYGASVAWHQDGTTRWDSPDWDPGTHGFNFMVQLYGSTAANGVWVIPGSHKTGKINIREIKAANGGSDRFPEAVPIVCNAGDVAITNRQVLHGSFANTSPDARVSVNFGFHRRESVLGVRRSNGEVYDEKRIHERSRIIALAIDARQERYPNEPRYVYQPLVGEEEANRWSEETRESILKNYNLNDLHL